MTALDSLNLPSLYPWQRRALDSWQRQNCRGVIEAVTGTGKTRIGIAAVGEELHRGGKALVLVPTLELQRQWVRELKAGLRGIRVGRLGGGKRDTLRTVNVLVAVVNSARGLEIAMPDRLGVLVGDECHRYGSASNQLALNPAFTRRLGLSATFDRGDDGNADWLEPYFGPICYKMEYAEALRDNVVAHFKVAMVGVKFSPGERAEYEEHDQRARDARRLLVGRYGVVPDPFAAFMQEVVELAGEWRGPQTIQARRYLDSFSKRADILASAQSKKAVLSRIAPAIIASARTLVFTQTIRATTDARNVLRESGIPSAEVHSQLSGDERHSALEAFKAGIVKALVAPRVLDEGIDVPAADLGVILAGSRSKRQMIQRMGRVLRKKADGRLARFAIVYVEGTSEDPTNGAHEDFLEIVRNVADAEAVFTSTASAATVCQFLSPAVNPPPLASSSVPAWLRGFTGRGEAAPRVPEWLRRLALRG